MNKYFELQKNGYLKWMGESNSDKQLLLFSDYTRYEYRCLKCGYVFKNTYSAHDTCFKCKSKNIEIIK